MEQIESQSAEFDFNCDCTKSFKNELSTEFDQIIRCILFKSPYKIRNSAQWSSYEVLN